MKTEKEKEGIEGKRRQTEALEDYISMQLCPLQSLFSVAPGMSDADTARLFSVAETVFYDMKKRIELALLAVRKQHGIIDLEITGSSPAVRGIVGVSFNRLLKN